MLYPSCVVQPEITQQIQNTSRIKAPALIPNTEIHNTSFGGIYPIPISYHSSPPLCEYPISLFLWLKERATKTCQIHIQIVSRGSTPAQLNESVSLSCIKPASLNSNSTRLQSSQKPIISTNTIFSERSS